MTPNSLKYNTDWCVERHAANAAHGHQCVTDVEGGAPRGFAYYAPAAMTEQTWYLYWIAVRRDLHGRGIGRQLLQCAESHIGAESGRVLFIETSSLPQYHATRQFYLHNGYDQEAVLRDFYARGDDMVVFRKELGAGSGKGVSR